MKVFLTKFICALAALLLFATSLPAKQKQRLALLIGNSNYIHGGSLPNPVNDVRAIKKALEGLGFTVMKYEDCSQKAMKRAMDIFGKKLKGKDVGLFFYAGHGVQVRGNNYLLPVDAKLNNENDAEYDCVRADRVLAKMEKAGSRTNIVILDACRDNPFERSWRRGTEGTGLAFMNAPSGSLIAYSTAPGKTALDGRGKNSPYTSALLQHIKTPDITVLQMFQKVRSTVMGWSKNKQTPWEATSLKGDFYLNNGSQIATKHHIELNSKDASAYVKRGHAYSELEQYAKAIQDFDKAIELGQQDEQVYFYRGHAYSELKQHAKAIQDFDKAIELHSKDAFDYANRGRTYTYSELKQYAKAIQDYNKGADSVLASTYTYRGWTYSELKQYAKAIQDFDKAIELNPKNALAYRYRGSAYFQLQEYVKAIQDFEKAMELDPKNAGFYYANLGDAYGKLNQYTKAIQDFGKAIELGQQDERVYFYRGHAYSKLKQHAKAIQDFDKAIELNPKNVWTYELRGFAYLLLNRTKQGCEDMNRACDLGNCEGLKAAINDGICHQLLFFFVFLI